MLKMLLLNKGTALDKTCLLWMLVGILLVVFINFLMASKYQPVNDGLFLTVNGSILAVCVFLVFRLKRAKIV